MAKILVIDDDASVNEVMVLMLRQGHYEPEGVTTVKAGLDRIAHSTYDLIITDIVMPDTDGIEAITLIRRTSPRIPILAVSGGGMIDSAQYLTIAGAMGATATLNKPFTKDTFLSAVRECLAKKV
jgi:two-component system, chemotaxis family, chemotaxis protein CheY